MGGGPASADVVRSSCFVTFPEQTHAEPVPVDAWYLFAAGLTFLRRLARDRVGDEMHIALLVQIPGNEDGERRYVSVGSNTVLQRALQDTFDCPDKALVLHVIDVGKVNPNVSPEPVEPMGLVFPTLSVDGLVTPTAVEVPSAQVTSESLYEQMSRSMFNYRKDDSSAFFVEERDYTRRTPKKEEQQEEKSEESKHRAGVPVAVEAVSDLLPPAKQVDSSNVEEATQGDESDIPVATVVETDATQIPRTTPVQDYRSPRQRQLDLLHLFAVGRASRRDECVDAARTPADASGACNCRQPSRRQPLQRKSEDSFVMLERHEL
ncbi:hypothetical protein GQ600_14462 [Phytophthora cactorum]|nr:hypothetical protein GQ600_14462 [Phytophthora cactorum]